MTTKQKEKNMYQLYCSETNMRHHSGTEDFHSQHIIFQQQLPNPRVPIQLLYQQCVSAGRCGKQRAQIDNVFSLLLCS